MSALFQACSRICRRIRRASARARQTSVRILTYADRFIGACRADNFVADIFNCRDRVQEALTIERCIGRACSTIADDNSDNYYDHVIAQNKDSVRHCFADGTIIGLAHYQHAQESMKLRRAPVWRPGTSWYLIIRPDK
jgi:hypothetical protein